MKFIKYFVLVTAIISVFGGLMLLNTGDFEFYAFWNVSALVLASWALFQRK